MRLPIAFLVATISLVAGCAVAPVVQEPPDEGPIVYPGHTLAHILAAMEDVAARDDVESFSSSGRVTLQSPQQNLDGTMLLRQRGADTLWASVRGPLNLEVARVLMTPEEFQIHDRLRNQLIVGPVEAAQQLFPGVTGPEDVFRTLTGTLLPDPNIRWAVTPGAVDGAPSYWLTAPDSRLRIAVDGRHWRVRRFERLGAGGRVVDSRQFSEFEPTEGLILPRRIVLHNPVEQTRVTFEHRRIELNPDVLSFPFNPEDATRIPFGGAPSSY
jgi:hypothetical protein